MPCSGWWKEADTTGIPAFQSVQNWPYNGVTRIASVKLSQLILSRTKGTTGARLSLAFRTVQNAWRSCRSRN